MLIKLVIKRLDYTNNPNIPNSGQVTESIEEKVYSNVIDYSLNYNNGVPISMEIHTMYEPGIMWDLDGPKTYSDNTKLEVLKVFVTNDKGQTIERIK